ncbi:MurR/RpiR family transcriptional regulator [Mammaliicoccus lentus]|jgi:DNA-binding MurR/RpiR family transcriptional regulator|uniref:MurR/RpiR family transcriptional regulator n=1 Tax=Mammaliicoccus lentus TaxID=42858 RepID=A0AAX3W4Y4_MAMLE|nr:MurR/RpiR family transcriptional regulator [Mammaliicoccus lentus]WHI60440.1 MurR/RpiR family transcriptional regulator [Mammaliicoccus lentus]
MENENILIKLKEQIKTLTNSERKVANYIIKEPTEVIFDTINELSKKVGTSTTTIMRLASKMGYSGYTKLQRDLQEVIKDGKAPQSRLTSNLKNIEKENLWIETINHYTSQLAHITNQVDESTLDKAVDLIDNARSICCTCVRSGLPAGQYLSQNVNRIKGNCNLIIANVSDWIDEVVSMDENDVLIAISYPRYAKRINEFVKIAKERNVKIIIITDTYSSPLVDYADVIIPCDSNSLAFHNSPILSLIAIDYIINSLALKESRKNSNRLDAIDHTLKRLNYHTNK